MNKAYRLVWSGRLGSFVAAAEFARNKGKDGKGGELLLVAATALSLLCVTSAGAAGVVVAGTTNTSVNNAANGVAVVDIAAASAAGLSHNKYKAFNVDSNGLVLNNNAAASAVTSQLAGAVATNAKLSAAAKLILNEVVESNRSALKGYMEVAGTRASVVVANPWGITCNGCGFINTDRATLSTGVPVIVNGDLEKLSVSDGDISIEGAGLKGQDTNILDLVARSVVVDGRIDANDLQMVAGGNDYNYANRSATAITASGTAPWLAIDSTALGGMYAQKITLIANEYGAGVRMLGDAAASGSDFTLTAARTIELAAKSISAKRNLAITSNNTDIYVQTGASLLAGESLSLKADSAINSSGNIASNGSMTLATSNGSINNTGTLKASGVLSANSGFLTNLGYISSGEGFKLDLVWRLTNGSDSNYGARIESTQDRGDSTYASSIFAGSDVINYGAIHTADDLSISATRIQNQGTGGITSSRALNLTAANAIENRGALYSGDRGLKLQAPTITNYTGGTIEAATSIDAKASVFNNYSVIRADSIAVTTDVSFYNGLETPVTAVLDTSTIVTSPASEPQTQIDFWQATGCSKCKERTLYQDAVTYREQYSSALPAVKPQMLALDTLTLDYGKGTATNYAGVISGDLVSITGSGPFTNQDINLFEITYYRRALDYKQNAGGWINATHAYLAATAAVPLTNANISNDEYSKLTTANSIAEALAKSALFEKSRVAYSSTGAGVYANTLYVSAGQVKNMGAPFSYGDSRLAQGGFSITLPTNPNGHYILNGNPKGRYLVVTNPDFVSTAARADAYKLQQMLGYGTDDELQLIGDRGYEDALIREQLIAANASQLLLDYGDAALIMRLRENAGFATVVQEMEYRQPLTYGEALTPEQVNNLRSDIVWMVKTKVKTKDGEKTVLAPRVYLSAKTRAMLGGAVLAAKDTTINAASVTNSGASITGAQKLEIKATGNIANESGSISGGNVSLAAQGDIVNKTLTQAQGNSRIFNTTLGTTGRIEATTGSLEMSAGQQIREQGAEIKAARNATLSAVGAMTFESIESKTSTSTSATNSPQNRRSTKNTTVIDNKRETTEKHIGSTVVAGNDIRLNSGADVTFKGSEVKAGGSFSTQNKGDVKILADQNKTMMHSESKAVGRGVNNARWGKRQQTIDQTRKTNFGSILEAQGNGTVDSSGALAVKGSQVKIGGDATLNARQGISIVDGKDEFERTSRTQTKSFLKRGGDTPPADTPPADKPAADKPTADKPTSVAQAGDGQASAKASAADQASGKKGFVLYERNKTTQTETKTKSVGSTITTGGKLDADTDKTLTVQGSGMTAGQTMNLQAGELKVLSGTNSKQTSSTRSGFAIGAFAEGSAQASAQAQAQGRGSNGGAATSVGASAKASAEGTLTLGFQKTNEKKNESTLTHTGSTLNSGGDMTLGAQGNAAFSGAQVDSSGNLAVSGQNVTNTAVQDTTHTSTSSNSHLFGINYAGAAKGEASVNAGAQAGIGAGAEASAKIEASLGGTAGVRYKNEQEKTTTDTVTQRTNVFTAKKDITRTASDTLSDQGTVMAAGGNIAQSARVITDQAVTNSTKTTSDTQTHDVRIGLQAGVSAEAGLTANATLTGPSGASVTKPDASGGVGVQLSYQGEKEKRETNTTTALTSLYIAGGDVSSTSSGTTTLEGTQIHAARDVKLQAGALKVGAARDTFESSTDKQSTDAKLTGTFIGTPGVAADLSHKDKTGQSEFATERGGAIKAGGNVTLSSGGDATFTGTQISSQGKTTVDAQGDVRLDAARSTSSSSTQSVNGSGGIKAGAGSVSGNVGVTYGKGTTSNTTGQGAQIDGKGGVVVTAGKGATLEGTQISSQGDVTITAKDQVRLLETTKTEKTTTLGVGLGFKGKSTIPDSTASKPTPTASGASPTPSTAERSGAGGGSRPAGGAGRGTAEPTSPGASGGTSKPTGGNATPDEAKPAAPPTMGLNANRRKTEATTSTATTLNARKINIKGGSVQDQGAKTQGKAVIEGPVEKTQQTNKRSTTGFEVNLGSPSKKAE